MSEKEIEALIELCRTGDAQAQLQAVIALENEGTSAAVPAILPLLKSTDTSIRNAAVDALGVLGHKESAVVGTALVALLDDAEALIRSGAAAALGQLRHVPARAALERALRHDGDWVVRASSAEALGDLGDARALAALQAALNDESAPVRRYAALSLGLIGDVEQLPALRSVLATEANPMTRAELLVSALRLGDERAFDDLLALFITVDRDCVLGLLNTIGDLLLRNTPPTVGVRATELDHGLAILGRLSDMAEAEVKRLQARLAALAQRPASGG